MKRKMKNIRKMTMMALVAFSVAIACGCTKPDDPNNGGGGGNSGGGGGGGLNGHAYVDLGLPSGTLWATCNVGADTPEGYGDYFAWGETQSGSGWCMPTYNQWRELKVSTNTSWTTQNGVNGRLFTASNGNSLFLPAAGYWGDDELYYVDSEGSYWSSSLSSEGSDVWIFEFGSNYCGMDECYLGYGRSVRLVRSSPQN